MRHATIVLVAVACLSIFLHAQTAEELVDKNIQAKGGMDKIKAIKSVRVIGSLKSGRRMRARTVQENQRPNLVRQTVSFQGMIAVTAKTGPLGGRSSHFGVTKTRN